MKNKIILVIICFVLISTVLKGSVTPSIRPQLEGEYEVWIECFETNPLCRHFERPLQMTVLGEISSNPSGYVSIRKEFGMDSLFLMKIVDQENEGRAFTSTSIGGMGFGLTQIFLEESSETNSLSGWIRNPRFKYDLRITARQLRNFSAFYVKSSLPVISALKNFSGTYDTAGSDLKRWTLNIKTVPGTLEPLLIASATTVAGAFINFDTVVASTDFRTLVLMHHAEKGNLDLKWVFRVSVHPATGTVVLHGSSLAVLGFGHEMLYLQSSSR